MQVYSKYTIRNSINYFLKHIQRFGGIQMGRTFETKDISARWLKVGRALKMILMADK
jgi:hypothetical protein